MSITVSEEKQKLREMATNMRGVEPVQHSLVTMKVDSHILTYTPYIDWTKTQWDSKAGEMKYTFSTIFTVIFFKNKSYEYRPKWTKENYEKSEGKCLPDIFVEHKRFKSFMERVDKLDNLLMLQATFNEI